MLYGPPGTGKTLLARAVAHHTDCTFIRVSGSELVQKYIGEGSRMVRELFVMARFVKKCSSWLLYAGLIAGHCIKVFINLPVTVCCWCCAENMLHLLFLWMRLTVLDRQGWNLDPEMVIVKFKELCWSFSIN